MKAAASGLAITRLALYEPPFRTDEEHPALASGSLTSSRLVAEKDAVYDATIIADLSMPAGLIASIENTDARDLRRKRPPFNAAAARAVADARPFGQLRSLAG